VFACYGVTEGVVGGDEVMSVGLVVKKVQAGWNSRERVAFCWGFKSSWVLWLVA